jgi:hypothetical protein
MKSKTIVIIDAQSATAEIYHIPKHLEEAQAEEIEAYYDITSDSEYIYGDLIVNDNR